MIGKKSALLLSAALSAVLISGCGIDNTDENIVGENLVLTQESQTPLLQLPKKLLGAKALAGIKSYKISYMTTNDKGEKVQASGLLTIPDLSKEFFSAYENNLIPALPNPKKTPFSFSLVSDQHGTIFSTENAPSKTTAENIAQNNPLALAYVSQALFMLIQPDYIGFGDSQAPHEYLLENSLASSSVDMIKAAIAFANKARLPINGQVFLSGYSEGGYATMATAKEIELHHPEIHLMAVAPMAGPYDMEKMAVGALSQEQMAFPPFLADVAYAYAVRYDDVNLSTVIESDYLSMLPTLFDTTHDGREIYGALPNAFNGGQNTDRLFIPSFRDDFISNSDNTLRKRLAENSVIDWRPKSPMKLIHCDNDMVVPYAMSQLAYASFTQQGSESVELVPITSVEGNASNPLQVHATCAQAAYAQVIPWFASIRKGEK